MKVYEKIAVYVGIFLTLVYVFLCNPFYADTIDIIFNSVS